ncbi:MAG TPA: biliverdin-producing heme oxygenase [Flavipsychrobacter sp.]|nr:biliverdin-producing heme oxygenase [Flavipsychrobacter sp.]
MYDLKPEAKHFLQRLKEETSEAHASLEENELSKRIVSSDLSSEEYAAYLSKMLPLHQALEERVFPQLETVFPDLEARKKTHLIQADLKKLNTTATGNVSFSEDMSFTTTLAGALGMMYVIEGSALGGKVILKQLHKSLPEEIYDGASNYFSVYGDKIGGMWMRFLQTFSDEVASKGLENDVIEGAKQSFSLVKNWFDK